MDIDQQITAIIPCILAGLCSFVVGWERERREKSAGIRTHLLVSLGSCIFTLVSIAMSKFALELFPGTVPPDPGRIAAQIVSGIGFLGGGVILRDSNRVTGLTTASTIWVSAAIGMLCGAHLYLLAILVTFLALGFLFLGRFVSHRIRASMYNWIIELRFKDTSAVDIEQLKLTILHTLETEKQLTIFNCHNADDVFRIILNHTGSTSGLSHLIRQLIPPSVSYEFDIKTLPRNDQYEEFFEITEDVD